MIKFRYLCLSIAACTLISLSSCTGNTVKSDIKSTPTVAQVAETSTHSGHSGKAKININNAILSQLDKLEATLGIPALSNKIQANRPYAEVLNVKKSLIKIAQNMLNFGRRIKIF